MTTLSNVIHLRGSLSVPGLFSRNNGNNYSCFDADIELVCHHKSQLKCGVRTTLICIAAEGPVSLWRREFYLKHQSKRVIVNRREQLCEQKWEKGGECFKQWGSRADELSN